MTKRAAQNNNWITGSTARHISLFVVNTSWRKRRCRVSRSVGTRCVCPCHCSKLDPRCGWTPPVSRLQVQCLQWGSSPVNKDGGGSRNVRNEEKGRVLEAVLVFTPTHTWAIAVKIYGFRKLQNVRYSPFLQTSEMNHQGLWRSLSNASTMRVRDNRQDNGCWRISLRIREFEHCVVSSGFMNRHLKKAYNLFGIPYNMFLY